MTVEVGDFLVVAHSNNKRNNGNNTISATLDGNLLTALSSADTTGGDAAWLFYSEISTAGTFDLDLDTSSSTKTVAHSTTYWVVDGDSGEAVVIADTAANSTSAATSLDLDFSFSTSIANGLGFSASASSIAIGESIVPATGWSTVVPGNGKRRTFLNSDVDGAALSSTFATSDATTQRIGLAGIVLTTTAVPEPSSTAIMMGLIGIAVIRRKRSA